ncbi:MAG: Htaa protein [Pseudonocardiales bacterium]|nr:Htaa protein [Pseudonocardiales bacterium]
MRTVRGWSSTVASLLLAAVLVLINPVSARAAPGLSVSPDSAIAPGATVTVSGSGYSTTVNNGVGIYVAWCKLVAQYWASADNCGDARWVHPGAGLSASGSFSVTLNLAGVIGATKCTVPGACKVVTMAAHGSSDRSQDAVVGVSFAVAVPPPAVSTPPPAPVPATTAITATTAPAPPTAAPRATTATTPASASAPLRQPPRHRKKLLPSSRTRPGRRRRRPTRPIGRPVPTPHSRPTSPRARRAPAGVRRPQSGLRRCPPWRLSP